MDVGLHLAFAPLVPLALLAGLAVAAALVVGIALWRRARGAWLRALVALAILATLANPSVVREERAPLKDVALVVRDTSPSMGVGDRAAAAGDAVDRLARTLAARPDLDVRVVDAGGGTDGTLLFSALDKALADVPAERLAGTFLVTDGQAHDAPDAAALAALAQNALKAPVHVLVAGRRGERDRRLTVEQAPSFGVVGQGLTLTVRVDDDAPADAAPTDGATGGQARLTLSQDGGAPVTSLVPIGPAAQVPVTLEHGGPTVVELSVEAGPDELTLDNNRAVVTINGVRDRLRVLLISGEPHPGERAWRNLLKADPSVDLVHFTILRPPEKQDGTPINELSLIAFPTRELFELKLNEFDLVVFDRYRRRGILPMTYLGNVARYVENGGAVLVAASPNEGFGLDLNQTPLGTVLPVETTGRDINEPFRPALTERGRRHPVTAGLEGAGAPGAAPAWGHWYRLIEADETHGDVLMKGAQDRPLLVLDRRGKGRVAELLSDHAWLWQRGHDGGGPQAELFRRLAHWLMKEPDLEEEDLRAIAQGFRLDIERRSLDPKSPPIEVTGPGNFKATVAMGDPVDGRAHGAADVTAPGLYRISDGTRQAIAAVGPLNPREFRDVRATGAVLAPVAKATGGGVAWLVDGLPEIRAVRPGRATAGDGWMGVRTNEAYRVLGVRDLPLLPGVLVLLLALGGLVVAWGREGR
jgi:hypothetical protein